jgi:hypothetical protein
MQPMASYKRDGIAKEIPNAYSLSLSHVPVSVSASPPTLSSRLSFFFMSSKVFIVLILSQDDGATAMGRAELKRVDCSRLLTGSILGIDHEIQCPQMVSVSCKSEGPHFYDRGVCFVSHEQSHPIGCPCTVNPSGSSCAVSVNLVETSSCRNFNMVIR